jgi:NAD-dependent DNA ligase
MKKIFYVVLFLVLPTGVLADDGNELLENCLEVKNHEEGKPLNEVARIRAAKCIAYLSGFGGADALSPLTRKGRRMFCIPKDVSLTDAALVTVDWMQKNEDKLKYSSHEVLAMANIVNFPCGA